MTYDLLFGLVAFAFVSSITPGPNNIMLMASGANFGLRASVQHMLGIGIGHSFMVVVVGLGMGQVFQTYPVLKSLLQIVSVAYLLWLAWRIATAAPPKDGAAKGRPFTFLQAAAFQWVNPKAWYMAIYAITNFTPQGAVVSGAFIVAAVFACTNLPCITVWMTLGTQLKKVLTKPARLRAFNWTMAALLVATLWPIVQPLFG